MWKREMKTLDTLILFFQSLPEATFFGGNWHLSLSCGCQGFTEPDLSTLLHKIASKQRAFLLEEIVECKSM
jgi:hypothetical protein